MAVTPRVERAARRHKAALDRLTQARQQALVEAWLRAWDTISVDLHRTVASMLREAQGPTSPRSRAARLRYQRAAQRMVADQLTALAQAAAHGITLDVTAAIRRTATDQRNLITAQLPRDGAGVAFRTVDEAALDAIVRRSTEQITARTWSMASDATDAMGRELVRAVAVGDNPRDAARLMVDRVHGQFAGGLPRALVISCTETIDAYRQGAQIAQDANRDLLVGWQWLCDLTPRTCLSCLAQHGSEHPLDEPGPLDHQRGRCARVPVTKSWAALGFHGVTEPPPSLKAGDGVRWLRSQPEQVQRDLMGPARYEAWTAGQYPPSAWSQVRHADGWRDSYRVGSLQPVGV